MDGRGSDNDHQVSASNAHVPSFGGNRTLENPQEQWRNDHGEADPRVIEALTSGDSSQIVNALKGSRVLVALTKSSVHEKLPSEVLHEKTSDMSIVCLTASDGRVGLLAFTSIDAMRSWNPEARPIPISGQDVSVAALDESASALIIDPAGPTPFTLTLPDLVDLSGEDQRWRAVALIQELLQDSGIESATVVLPDSGPLVVGVAPDCVEVVAQLLTGQGDIHAFTPEGIAIELSD